MASTENAPAKRRPGRPKSNATTTTTTTTTTTKRAPSVLGTKAAGVKKSTTSKRQPLDEITNKSSNSDDEDMDDDFDILSDDRGFSDGAMTILPKPAQKQIVSPITTNHSAKEDEEAQKPRGRRGRPRTIKQEIPETQPEPEVISASSNFGQAAATTTTRRGRPAKREMIPETQPEPMVVEESEPPSTEPAMIEEPVLKAAKRQTSRVPSLTRQRQPSASRGRQPSISRRRDISGSRPERGGTDVTLSRKVGDLTKKLELLELKYENLHTVGVREAESNFDKLKNQTELKSKAADNLIISLRAELAAERQRSSEAEQLRKDLQALRKNAESSQADKKTLQTQLNEAKNEAKSLQAKLAAARSSSADAGASKVPSSAIKQNGGRTILVGAAEGAKEAQKRLLKEELYRDLTGLLVMDVKRRETEDGEEDVFDCIQTGRNGSLHFHLAVAVPGTSNTAKTPSASNNTGAPSFDDTEFQYEPKLNNERDRDLFDILPDYLTEDICFPRSNAAKFYARVVDCLTKKVEVVEEDEEMEEVTTVKED